MTTTLRAPFTVAAVIIALVAACVTRLGRRVMPPARRAQDLSSGARGEAIADAPAGDATDTPGDPKGYELAYEAGLRAVEGQESSLRDIRSRATTLLNLITAVIVSGVVVADLVVGQNQPGDAMGCIGIIGVAAAAASFVGVLWMAAKVLLPVEAQFGLDTRAIIRDHIETQPPATLSGIHRELALWLGEHADSNRKMLDKKLSTLNWGWGFLGLEIIGTILVIGDLAYG